MKIALAQTNPHLGNFEFNAKQILRFSLKAHKLGADLVAFPELSLTGYPLFDLPENISFIKKQNIALKQLHKKLPENISILVGALTQSTLYTNGKFYNSVISLHKNKKLQFFSKKMIPGHDVFDEFRFVLKAPYTNPILKIKGKKFLIHICEDSWIFNKKPEHIKRLVPDYWKQYRGKINGVINLSASPFTHKKQKDRLILAKSITKYFKAPLIYVNAYGAQDEIIFDGRSFVYEPRKKLIHTAKDFQEDLVILDTDSWQAKSALKHSSKKNKKLSHNEAIKHALVLGLKEFVAKGGHDTVHLGLSGGVDSALVAVLSVKALGAKQVKAFALPGPYSTALSLKLAQKQAQLLNIPLKIIRFENLYKNVSNLLEKKINIKKMSIVHENLQARLRAIVLMAYSNHTGSLLLNTSNKSELSMGYTTLYGDAAGGLAPIGDLLKTEIYKLAQTYVDEGLLLQKIYSRTPTAELRPRQKDLDTLPHYNILDSWIIEQLFQNDKKKYYKSQLLKGLRSPHRGKSLSKRTSAKLYEKLHASEFKRYQTPPVLKLSERAFDYGRRYPIHWKF